MIPYYEFHSVFRDIFRSLNVIQAPKIQIETILKLNGSGMEIETMYGFIFSPYDGGINTYTVEGMLARTEEIFCGVHVITNSFSKYEYQNHLLTQYGIEVTSNLSRFDGKSETMIAYF